MHRNERLVEIAVSRKEHFTEQHCIRCLAQHIRSDVLQTENAAGLKRKGIRIGELPIILRITQGDALQHAKL